MLIGGLQKFSLTDYPGKVCAIIFTIGCNFRCSYCHNPELVQHELFPEPIPEEEIFAFLESRRGKLDAIVVTGGEPTLHQDLIPFMRRIKDLGFLIKLDTQGSKPDHVEQIIKEKLVDYFAMDIKAPLAKYKSVMQKDIDPALIARSIKLIMNSGADYEFRTTIVKSLTSPEDLEIIGQTIQGAKRYYLQKFIPSKHNDPSFINAKTYSDEEFAVFREQLSRYIGEVGVR